MSNDIIIYVDPITFDALSAMLIQLIPVSKSGFWTWNLLIQQSQNCVALLSCPWYIPQNVCTFV